MRPQLCCRVAGFSPSLRTSPHFPFWVHPYSLSIIHAQDVSESYISLALYPGLHSLMAHVLLKVHLLPCPHHFTPTPTLPSQALHSPLLPGSEQGYDWCSGCLAPTRSSPIDTTFLSASGALSGQVSLSATCRQDFSRTCGDLLTFPLQPILDDTYILWKVNEIGQESLLTTQRGPEVSGLSPGPGHPQGEDATLS